MSGKVWIQGLVIPHLPLCASCHSAIEALLPSSEAASLLLTLPFTPLIAVALAASPAPARCQLAFAQLPTCQVPSGLTWTH